MCEIHKFQINLFDRTPKPSAVAQSTQAVLNPETTQHSVLKYQNKPFQKCIATNNNHASHAAAAYQLSTLFACIKYNVVVDMF